MRDLKYIIKRIIIGVGIALVLMMIKGNFVLKAQAKEISSYNWGAQYYDINSGYASVDFSINTNPWANWRYGYLYFGFSINKTGGSSTDPILLPRYVVAYSDTTGYVCNIGTNTNSNSTWTGSAYSVTCPMDLGAPGLTRILINFQPFSQQTSSTYQVIIGGIGTYESADSTNITLNQTDTTNAINNQITNDNTNTNNIINNQNQNTQQQIESQMVCSVYDKNAVVKDGYSLNASGSEISKASYGITDYINIYNSSVDNLFNMSGYTGYTCFYNVNKTLISCDTINQSSGLLTLPSNSYYLRTSISKSYDRPILKVCKNGNQALAEQQQQINNTLNDDNVNGATGEASDFFSNFTSDSHGLSGIITAPLRLIQSLSSSTCSSLTIPLPFVQTNATLPCMSTIYSTYFPTFLSLYQLITTGLIGYWVLIKIFGHVKGMQDPKDDRIEVFEL